MKSPDQEDAEDRRAIYEFPIKVDKILSNLAAIPNDTWKNTAFELMHETLEKLTDAERMALFEFSKSLPSFQAAMKLYAETAAAEEL